MGDRSRSRGRSASDWQRGYADCLRDLALLDNAMPTHRFLALLVARMDDPERAASTAEWERQ